MEYVKNLKEKADIKEKYSNLFQKQVISQMNEEL